MVYYIAVQNLFIRKKSLDKRLIKKRFRYFRRNIRRSITVYPLRWIIGAVVFAAIITVIIILAAGPSSKTSDEKGSLGDEQVIATMSPEEIAESQARQEAENAQKAIDDEIASYGEIGFVKLNDEGGYLFIREEPNEISNRIGKLYNNAAVSIIRDGENVEKVVLSRKTAINGPGAAVLSIDSDVAEDDGSDSVSEVPEGWTHIYSGGIDGYVKSEYIITGEEANELARKLISERAIITADSLSVRSEPNTDSDKIDTVRKGERYLVTGKTDGWINISKGWISSEYAERKVCLDEAVELSDVLDKDTALNMYTNLGMTNIKKGHINMRAGAGTDKKITGMLLPNCAVQILETEGDWYYIQSGPVKGYVSSEFITTGAEARGMALQQAQLMAISTADGVNVRSEPNTDCEVFTTIVSSERYPVIEELEGWVHIDLGDTDEDGNPMTAYVSRDYVEVRYALNEAFAYSEEELQAANSDSRRASIVQYALQFIGNRYVWGGTSLTNGCDCSGFTQSVLGHFGVWIPRTSRDQANAGRKITSDQLRPGDLIFYANKSGTINHVTLYIGGGRIVGAQSTRSGIKTAAWNYRTPVKIVNVMGD